MKFDDYLSFSIIWKLSPEQVYVTFHVTKYKSVTVERGWNDYLFSDE